MKKRLSIVDQIQRVRSDTGKQDLFEVLYKESRWDPPTIRFLEANKAELIRPLELWEEELNDASIRSLD